LIAPSMSPRSRTVDITQIFVILDEHNFYQAEDVVLSVQRAERQPSLWRRHER
jgi:hypothetical protein